MNKTLFVFLIAIGALLFAACPPGPETGNTGPSNTDGEGTEKTVQAQIEEIDDKFGEEMAKKNADFFNEHVSDNFVGVSPEGGRMDKAMGLHFIKNNPCEGKSNPATERKVHEFSEDVVLLTGKGTGERTCDGKTEKSAERYAVLWLKDGDKWKGAFYQGIMLPAEGDAKPADAAKEEEKPAADGNAKAEEKPAAEDGGNPMADMPKENAPNDAELAKTLGDMDKKLWEAWSKSEAKPFEEALGEQYVHVQADGVLDRAGGIKMISEAKCEVKSWSIANEKATKVNDNFVVLTYTGNQDGTCEGNALDKTVTASSIYMKDGDSWKLVFHMETPVKMAS